MNLRDFEIGKPLPRGKYGCVYMARRKEDKKYFALKVFNCQTENAYQRSVIQNEIKINLSLPRHPNLIQAYFGFDLNGERPCIGFELGFDNLYNLLSKQQRFDETSTKKIIRDVLEGLSAAHQKDIAHLDIKPENIIGVKSDNEITYKLADWGHSTNRLVYGKLRGTLDYLSPEMVKGIMQQEHEIKDGEEYHLTLYDPKKVDVWQIGILLYECLAGYPPFEMEEQSDTFRQIISADVSFPKHFSDQAKELITFMLNKDPDKRPSIEEIRAKAYFNFEN